MKAASHDEENIELSKGGLKKINKQNKLITKIKNE